MVFLDVADVAIIVGLLAGGRFDALADVQIKAKGLAFLAVAVQLAAFPSDVLPWSTPPTLARWLWVGSYGLIILMLALNYRLFGTPLIAAGLSCNLVAIIANGGLMPVHGSALRAAGRSYHVHNNSIALVKPHLSILVDRWAAPDWLPFANVFSIGDILIALGTAAVIIAAMRRPARSMRHRRSSWARRTALHY